MLKKCMKRVKYRVNYPINNVESENKHFHFLPDCTDPQDGEDDLKVSKEIEIKNY